MTPEEIKAEQLINSFYKYAFEDIDGVGKWMNAKQCAIIAVNYRIEALNDMWLWDAIDEQKEIIEEIEKL